MDGMKRCTILRISLACLYVRMCACLCARARARVCVFVWCLANVSRKNAMLFILCVFI